MTGTPFEERVEETSEGEALPGRVMYARAGGIEEVLISVVISGETL